MIKKVVIAAAGQGTRMMQLTKDKPKHLIEIDGKPFLSYVLDNLLKAGYEDFIIVVGYEGELIKNFLKKYGYRARIINQFETIGPKEKIYGTACPLMCVKDINEQFMYLCGDDFYSSEDLKAMDVNDDYNYVAGAESDHPENFGALLTEGEFLKEIVEKPKDFTGNLVNTSLYKFTSEIFEKVSQIKKSSRGEYEITDAVSLLAKDRKVKVRKIKDFWMDIGRPEDIEKLGNFLNENT
jgi:UDP-N-acetylglucosamine diphosphorylase / glucose-1-phosphate thymidylyltransferase / UDP-N-acetylgalactosamine diphosphorylase / glucosamine-1-phosphate N-acetyltransferase / galactosamine-1-phosphate N-acetyltransferase